MGIIGLGKSPRRSCRRVPRPPARMIACFMARSPATSARGAHGFSDNFLDRPVDRLVRSQTRRPAQLPKLIDRIVELRHVPYPPFLPAGIMNDRGRRLAAHDGFGNVTYRGPAVRGAEVEDVPPLGGAV